MIAKERQKKDFDKYHRAKETPPPLAPGERVWIPDRESEALVESEVAPRSYEFTTSEGSTVRRNQSSVRRLPGTPQNDQGEEEPTRDSAERNSELAKEQDRSTSETSDVSAKETDTIATSPKKHQGTESKRPLGAPMELLIKKGRCSETEH